MKTMKNSKGVMVADAGSWTVRASDGRVATVWATCKFDALMKGARLWADAREVSAEKVGS